MARAQLILDRYRPIAEAGAGGFGTVKVAWDTRIQRKVAIKCIELSEFDALRVQGAAASASEHRNGGSEFFHDPNGMDDLDRDDDIPFFSADDKPENDSADNTDRPAPHPSFFSDMDETEGEAALFETPIGPDSQVDLADAFPAESPFETENLASGPGSLASEDFIPEHSLAHVPGLDEARTAAMLADANIVAVYDFEVQGSTAYLIMEYVEGMTLKQLLRDHADALTLDVTAAVFSSVAHALEVAHAHQVLHLDIKPDNVLIDHQGQVKVTDFGLATLADAGGFGTTGGGTIGYMPLEQMRQESLDARSDEWALASLTYEMLTGKNPFIAPTLERAETAIEDAELVLPSLCWGDMDTEMDDVLFFALDPDRDERYDTVADFAEALEPFLGNPKRGHKELAVLVGHAEDEDEEAEPAKPHAPRTPWVERVSDRCGAVIARLLCTAGAALVGVVAAANLPWVSGWDSPLLWGLVALCVVAAAIKPHMGTLAAFSLWGASMALCGAPLLGCLLVAVAVLWWWFVGREGNAPSVAALAQPLLGATGFAGFAPLVAGCCLDVRRAAATAAFSALCALLMSGCAVESGLISWMGTDLLAGWNVGATLPGTDGLWASSFPGVNENGLVAALADVGAWCTAVGWIAAAAVWSAFCLKGTRTFDVLGAIAACACLIVGACAAAWATANVALWTPTPPPFETALMTYLPDALVPGIAAIVAAALGIPDRVRWEAEEAQDS